MLTSFMNSPLKGLFINDVTIFGRYPDIPPCPGTSCHFCHNLPLLRDILTEIIGEKAAKVGFLINMKSHMLQGILF